MYPRTQRRESRGRKYCVLSAQNPALFLSRTNAEYEKKEPILRKQPPEVNKFWDTEEISHLF